ncbi:hypothetical protein LXD69_13505 [Flavobacterium sediminilitoris]|uniref:Uncharacterized protein n=1 Tax=Flavobacterium sediminilitoris TaxID=2024526 RepID=A0ABY4HMJ9_9FLAO|nr:MULTISPECIES: hypothetical protein [Flavobacterium]UOX33049.1 hypothetical protein LXD69_13505 [Flavobacterium sediminilitoris]
MKKLYSFLAIIAFSLNIFSQAPEKMSYQAVVRDASDALIVSTTVGMQISILEGSSTGTPVYVETQTPTTNTNGLISIEIGNGTVVSGDFTTIDWSTGSYFIKTETDPTGGTSYTITGESQLLSVPYALFSKNSGGVAGAEWTTNGNNINNTNTGSVVVGPNVNNSNLNFYVTNTGSPKMAIGNMNNFNNVNSGELHFAEDTNYSSSECGIKLQHNGALNNLYIIGGCPTSDTIARFGREGNTNLRQLRLGTNYNMNTGVQLSVDGNSDFTGDVNIIGNLNVTGNIAKGGGTFKIDHPLDPKNQYLIHSFVESPEMMNIYSGNATTDNNGYVTVTLPKYFEAANKDFRYQLTSIGSFSQAIIKEKISGNKFVIQTSTPNVEVSWQITAVRADKFANENRIIPEKEKEFKGTYLHPELYGASEEQSENFVRNQKAIKEATTQTNNADGQ